MYFLFTIGNSKFQSCKGFMWLAIVGQRLFHLPVWSSRRSGSSGTLLGRKTVNKRLCQGCWSFAKMHQYLRSGLGMTRSCQDRLPCYPFHHLIIAWCDRLTYCSSPVFFFLFLVHLPAFCTRSLLVLWILPSCELWPRMIHFAKNSVIFELTMPDNCENVFILSCCALVVVVV